MGLGLKRKRVIEVAPRKNRKVREEDEGDKVDNGHDPENQPSERSEAESDINVAAVEDEWEGLEASREENSQLGTKPKKPPTGEELRNIKDAADLFKSSSFKLQIDALLPNVRPKASRIPPLERFLLHLHSFILKMAPISPLHPLEGARKLLKKHVAVPYAIPLPSEETNWKVAFETPSDITVVGSWANKVCVKPKDGLRFGVDLAVEMPNSLFQEKDYLNGRFFHKRAFYLASIAAAIQNPKSGLNVDVLYESYGGDARLTKLVLIPRKDDTQTDFSKLNAQICILPVLQQNSPIALHRLSPSHSNIRVNSVNASTSTEVVKESNPTPLYNTALLLSFSPKMYLLATHSLAQDSPAFRDALTLLRVWANQRGYTAGARMCVRGFENSGVLWSQLLAMTITGEECQDGVKTTKRKPLGRGLSSYQLFKAALDILDKHNFVTKPAFVRAPNGHRFPSVEYKITGQAYLVDSLSLVNLFASIPLGSLDLLRYDAQKTLETLDKSNSPLDPFTDTFLMEQRDISTRFDTVLRVDLTTLKLRRPSITEALEYASSTNAAIASLSSLIRHALGERAHAVAVLHPSSASRSTIQAHPSTPEVIFIGIVHNPEHAYSLVDHGPATGDGDQPSDQAALQRFKDLWGDKSELRRFKDGRIVESVVWDVKTVDERAHVPALIVKHILLHHFGLGEEAVQTSQVSFDSMIRLPPSISSMYTDAGIPAGFKSAITAYDSIVKAIKALDEELPLALLNVHATSAHLRYTSVFSPVPLPPALASAMPPNAQYVAPIEFIFEFEKSSRWPDDLRAIQKIKLAFFERIASALMNSVHGLRANVVVGDGVHTSEILDKAHLEIVTSEGWAFSAWIWHDREVTLLDNIVEHTNKLPHVKVKLKRSEEGQGKLYYEAVEAKEVYMRRFIHAPRHHRAIAALCHQHTAFAGTVRLVKRWLASHWLLHGHIYEELVELICALFFVGNARQSIPGSKERGFACVVRFLKDWAWEDGLFVPLFEPDVDDVVTTMKMSGPGVWTVKTDFDKEGRIWTAPGPDLVVAHRVRALAKATWTELQSVEQGTFVVKALFLHPTDDYDFVVQLDPVALPRYVHAVNVDVNVLSRHGKYANKLKDDQSSHLLPGFDPAQLLFDDLQRIYADTFKIFHDPFGGDKFGAVWDPTLKQSRPFRVMGGYSTVPLEKESDKTKGKGLVLLNEAGVLGEIERLGSGLIKSITVHK